MFAEGVIVASKVETTFAKAGPLGSSMSITSPRVVKPDGSSPYKTSTSNTEADGNLISSSKRFGEMATADAIQIPMAVKEIESIKEANNIATGKSMNGTPRDSLTVIDNRTGKPYELPIENNSVNGKDLNTISLDIENRGVQNPGLYIYDPGFRYTAPLKSHITEMYVLYLSTLQ
jgi:hypothetical protein